MGLLSDWEAVLINGSSSVRTRDDISSSMLVPMGTRQEILFNLKDTFTSLDISDPGRLVLHGGDFNVRFDIGEEEPVRLIKLYIDGDIPFVFQALCGRYGWKVFNPLLDVYVDVKRPAGQPAGPGEKGPPESGPGVNSLAVFFKYFGAAALLLALDSVVNSHVSADYLITALGILISLFTWYIVFRYGIDNHFVTIKHALLMALAVSLALAGINMAKYWEEVSASGLSAVLPALSVVVLVRTAVYTLVCYLGIRMRT